MKVAALVSVLTLTLTPAGSTLSRHDAKLRTFDALLKMTERTPDQIDVTHSAITVAGCARTSYGFRCRGVLNPTLQSGILTGPCSYVVRVYAKRTDVELDICS